MGLEIALAGRDLDEAFDELEARLAERPGFYRGTSATANFGATPPGEADVERLRTLLEGAGIELSSITQGEAAPPEAELERRRAMRPVREVRLSDSARSLVADFAGARTDIAERRKRGESSVRRLPDRLPAEEPSPVLRVVEAAPETLYHVGTLRGGQALHHMGNIVVVGDVNPGAELVATGDVVVFGRLAGVAHAGAQGEMTARVFALDLDATQLRIATFIAADTGAKRTPRPEAALVRDGRIAVVPFDQLDALGATSS
jgi:septum site-determining protein MinC